MIRTLLSRFGSPLLLIAVFGVALGWYKASLREAEERGKTAVALAQRDTARAVLDSVQLIRAQADSADSVKAAALARTAQDAKRAAQGHARRAETLQGTVDSLLASGTPQDSQSALTGLLQVNVELSRAGAACAVGWRADSLALALCREGRLRADSSLHETVNLLRETERLLAVSVKRASPGFLTTARRSLPFVAATAVLVLLLTR